MMLQLDDQSHERLWRICDALLSTAGARAALVCDAATGAVLVSVGDASGSGTVARVETLAGGARVVHGDGGEIYGVDVPGGALLVVLHDAAARAQVRAAAAKAVGATAHLIAHLPPPPPPPPWPPAAKKRRAAAAALKNRRRKVTARKKGIATRSRPTTHRR